MKYSVLFFLFILLFFYACDDIFVPNLESETFDLILPMDSDSLTTYSTSFWWDEVDGATGYNLQIVGGTFNIPTSFVLDSLVSGNMFTVVLENGSYEWRVRAENNASNTVYFTRSFTIAGTDDLSEEELILIAPNPDDYLNNSSPTFEWFGLPQASNYLFELRDENGDLEIPIQSLSTTSFSVSLNEGIHTWSVQGTNDLSATAKTSRNLFIDLTIPSAILDAPLDDALLDTTNVEFSWINGASLAPVSDSLFIYSDSLVTIVSADQVNGESIALTLGVGSYFWTVKPFDAAGNQGMVLAARKFTIM